MCLNINVFLSRFYRFCTFTTYLTWQRLWLYVVNLFDTNSFRTIHLAHITMWNKVMQNPRQHVPNTACSLVDNLLQFPLNSWNFRLYQCNGVWNVLFVFSLFMANSFSQISKPWNITSQNISWTFLISFYLCLI